MFSYENSRVACVAFIQEALDLLMWLLFDFEMMRAPDLRDGQDGGSHDPKFLMRCCFLAKGSGLFHESGLRLVALLFVLFLFLFLFVVFAILQLVSCLKKDQDPNSVSSLVHEELTQTERSSVHSTTSE